MSRILDRGCLWMMWRWKKSSVRGAKVSKYTHKLHLGALVDVLQGVMRAHVLSKWPTGSLGRWRLGMCCVTSQLER